MKSQAPSVVLQAIFILSQRTYICQSHRIAFRWAGVAALSPRFAIGSWLALRFCRRALPSVHGWCCGSVAAFCLGSRLSFSSLRKKRRLAIACVPVPPGRDRHSRVLQCRRGYLPWRVHFGAARFLQAISTGDGMRGTVWPCASVAALCHRLMAGVAFLSPRFASVHACLFPP